MIGSGFRAMGGLLGAASGAGFAPARQQKHMGSLPGLPQPLMRTMPVDPPGGWGSGGPDVNLKDWLVPDPEGYVPPVIPGAEPMGPIAAAPPAPATAWGSAPSRGFSLGNQGDFMQRIDALIAMLQQMRDRR